ncbi:type II toxin-antitoxin system RelE/ParE family toxin [Roseospira navarrensis]|uniref:type II toxin-antitoxin system RelE/ParE family toxin n=1 Tax=Roseospira navarrensis TaxID=140058 RepID=UPI0031B630D5
MIAPQGGCSYAIRHYLTPGDGRDLFANWLAKLRDRTSKLAILRRVNRLEQGQFGDCKPCRDGVWELRVDVGPGYRVYYALAGETVVLLLCGGTKKTQDRDIARAVSCWRDWCRRDDDER